jgi:hypothetical protein
VRDNADTEPSADTPELEPATATRAGGVPRNYTDSACADALLEYLAESAGPRLLLQLVLDHVADGGIIIEHDGGLVLTWADGGASRRLSESSDS